MNIVVRLCLTILFIVLSFLSLYIIDLGTAKPGQSAGNGNPLIIIEFLSIPIYLLSFIYTYKLIKELRISRMISSVSIVISIVAIAALGVMHYHYIRDTIIALGGGPEEPESWIYRFGWFNQYTNTFYYHPYVYSIIVLMIIVIALLMKYKRS